MSNTQPLLSDVRVKKKVKTLAQEDFEQVKVLIGQSKQMCVPHNESQRGTVICPVVDEQYVLWACSQTE